ncbi:MAG TPA: hypothetical protein VGD80_21115 [Kofleriaceae bacterium]
MSAVCPACGVAVVPGYVRCPKCHAGLPVSLGRTKRTTLEPGGTAVVQRGFPITPVLIAVGVAVVIILVFGLRGTSKKAEPVPAPPPQPIEAIAVNPPPAQVAAGPRAQPAPSAPEAAVQDPGPAVAELKLALRDKRLWGSVAITGQRIDVRSGSCADPGMQPLIETKKSLLHSAGLTKLRCVEQSGAVVFERDL